jgi:hypothetical protein
METFWLGLASALTKKIQIFVTCIWAIMEKKNVVRGNAQLKKGSQLLPWNSKCMRIFFVSYYVPFRYSVTNSQLESIRPIGDWFMHRAYRCWLFSPWRFLNGNAPSYCNTVLKKSGPVMSNDTFQDFYLKPLKMVFCNNQKRQAARVL